MPRDGGKHGTLAYDERASGDLPLESRGGGSVQHYAPYDGTYTVRGYLTNNGRNNTIDKNQMVELKVPLKAGLHEIGMSFPKSVTLDETTAWLYSGIHTGGVQGIVLANNKPVPVTLNVQVDGLRVK